MLAPCGTGRAHLKGSSFNSPPTSWWVSFSPPPALGRVSSLSADQAVDVRLRWAAAWRARGVIGVSKGAELALLCTTYFPEHFGAAVAYAPSAVAFAGISSGGEGWRRSSWSYRGEPVPFVPYAQGSFRRSLRARGLARASIYRAALQNADSVEKARITIENTGACFLLITGGHDRVWPSSQMAEMLVARMSGAGQRERVEHLHFRSAGHNFIPSVSEITPRPRGRALQALRLRLVGGSPSANRLALQEAWPKAVTFLRSSLR